MNLRIHIVIDDITRQDTEAIVNASNAELIRSGGVCEAIFDAAGPELEAECRRLGSCQTGSAIATEGFDLAAKYVIHAVGPVWHGGHYNEERLLRLCYQRSFELAIALDVQSIALPAISTGLRGFPGATAARIAWQTTMEFGSYFELVKFVTHNKLTYGFYQALYETWAS